MPLLATTAAALALAAAIPSGAVALPAPEMRTENAMPAEADVCQRAPCQHGALFADALTYRAGDGPAFSYAVGKDFGWGGWAAGVVSVADATGLYGFGGAECVMKLRGVTIIRMMNAMVSSIYIGGNTAGGSESPVLQFNGLRVIYSTTLPAPKRLLGVLVWDTAANDFRHVHRTTLYTVAAMGADVNGTAPYSEWTNPASPLPGESSVCGTVHPPGAVVTSFLLANSPYDIPDVAGRLVGETGGAAMVVEQDPAICKSMDPPRKYDAALESCVGAGGGVVAKNSGSAGPLGVLVAFLAAVVAAVAL